MRKFWYKKSIRWNKQAHKFYILGSDYRGEDISRGFDDKRKARKYMQGFRHAGVCECNIFKANEI